MSTWVDRARRLRARAADDGGFTLLEIMVALVILGLIAAALAPVMISAARASVVAKRSTVAKNLSQQRIDAMRNLTFHVDAQNGPFLDLLDDYYPNISTTTTTLTAINGQGHWVSNGIVPGGIASGPYYQSTFQNAFGVNGFTQTVYTQFLTSAQPLPAIVPGSAFASYNSNAVGHDQPPSLLLGVTVVTAWTGVGGGTRSYRTFTEITNTNGGGALITSESRATALLVKSNAYDGSQLEGAVGVVRADGSLANTSSATAYAQAAYVHDNGAGIDSSAFSAISPPNPSGSTAAQATESAASVGSSGCGWGSYGQNQVNDVSANTAGGLPVAPSDVGTASTPAATVQAMLRANGSGCTSSGFWFTNQIDGSPATDPKLQLDSDKPMVNIFDVGGGGSLVTSQGSIAASSAIGTPGAVSSTAAVSYVSRVQIFRAASFVPSGQNVCGTNGSSPCGNGLVNVFLTNASLRCSSQQSPTGSYSGYLTYYTATGWHTVPLNYSSATSSSDPLASIDLSQTVTTYGGSPVPLSAYIGSWSTARSIAPDSVSGASTLSSIVAITTAPTRVGDAGSTIGIGIGNLSCVASDLR